jgi:DNA-binding MarR family transcriptional regulator
LDYVARFKNPRLFWGDYDETNEFVMAFIRHMRDGLKHIGA